MSTSPAPGIGRKRPDQRAILIGNSASLIGACLFVASATTMVVLWVRLLFLSMNWLGLALGLLTAPLAAAYPFLHWFVRGAFPGMIFAVWLVGVLGMSVTMVWASWGRHRALETGGKRSARGLLGIIATEESD